MDSHGKVSKVLLSAIFSLLLLVNLQLCLAENQQEERPEVLSEQCTLGMSSSNCATQPDEGGCKESMGSCAVDYADEVEGRYGDNSMDHTSNEKEDKSRHEKDKYRDFLHRSMERLEGMLEDSRTQVMNKLERLMDKMAHSRDRMMKKLDALLDSVSHSRIVQELDHLLEEVSHSKIIEDMKSLPRELKESLLLSVRNRSYVAAGIMVAITTAVLVGGSLYFAWCHHDGWSVSCDYRALGMSAVTAVTGSDKHQDSDGTDAASAESKDANGTAGTDLLCETTSSSKKNSNGDHPVKAGVSDLPKASKHQVTDCASSAGESLAVGPADGETIGGEVGVQNEPCQKGDANEQIPSDILEKNAKGNKNKVASEKEVAMMQQPGESCVRNETRDLDAESEPAACSISKATDSFPSAKVQNAWSSNTKGRSVACPDKDLLQDDSLSNQNGGLRMGLL